MDEDDVAEVQSRIEGEGAELDSLGLPEFRVAGGAAVGGQVPRKQQRDACEGKDERPDPDADRAPRMAAAGAGETFGHAFEFFALGCAAQLIVRGTACGAGWRTRGLRPRFRAKS